MYVRTYIHTYVLAYVRTRIHACMLACKRAFTRFSVRLPHAGLDPNMKLKTVLEKRQTDRDHALR